MKLSLPLYLALQLALGPEGIATPLGSPSREAVQGQVGDHAGLRPAAVRESAGLTEGVLLGPGLAAQIEPHAPIAPAAQGSPQLSMSGGPAGPLRTGNPFLGYQAHMPQGSRKASEDQKNYDGPEETHDGSISGPSVDPEIPFRLSDGYLIVVEGQIGDRSHLKFILDTGASVSIVDRKIARILQLNRQKTESFNFDRNLTWERATVPELRFGPIKASNLAMLVGNLKEYSEFARNADAIIGLDLLSLTNLTVDYAAKKLIFRSPGQGTGATRRESPSNGLFFEIQVQGRPVRLIVDTGFPNLLLFEERLQTRVPGLSMPGRTLQVTIGSRLHAKQTTLPGVTIGPAQRDVSVLLTKSPAPEVMPGIDGVMGIALLDAHRVNLDFVAGKLSWD